MTVDIVHSRQEVTVYIVQFWTGEATVDIVHSGQEVTVDIVHSGQERRLLT